MVLLFVAGDRTEAQQFPAVKVLVYNYAGLPAGHLRQAEEMAARIFRHAGVKLEPVLCPTRPSEVRDAHCGVPDHEGYIALRIMSGKKEILFGAETLAGGVSPLPQNGGFGTVANVSVDRASALADHVGGSSAVFLGGFIAHELGHLLLNASDHNYQGIMHSPWTGDELDKLQHGVLRFTHDEANRLRVQIQDRLAANPNEGAPR
jgi:hypothetical protein